MNFLRHFYRLRPSAMPAKSFTLRQLFDVL